MRKLYGNGQRSNRGIVYAHEADTASRQAEGRTYGIQERRRSNIITGRKEGSVVVLDKSNFGFYTRIAKVVIARGMSLNN